MYMEGEESLHLENYIPEKTCNKYAICFTITGNYCFAAANVIMGLYRHSPELMNVTDIVIYHDGISEKNMQLLKSLHQNILYPEIAFPACWKPLVEHPQTLKWGRIIAAKLFSLFLVHRYEKVLLMDVDMHVTGDISELFDIKEAVAWRPVVAWEPKTVFASILDSEDSNIHAGNGGLWLFDKGIKEYQIGVESICEAFNAIKDLHPGGMDELVLAWIIHTKKIAVRELDICYFNTPVQTNKTESKLIHFLDYKKVCTKPWKNPASYYYFTHWVEDHHKWLDMGGDGVIAFTRDDYFKMFGFEKAKEINDLKKKEKRLREICKENEKIEKELKELKKIEKKLCEVRGENEKLKRN